MARLWERHLLNCAPLAALLPPDATVADVGSGAGLPGVVLAILRPDVRVTLVEPLLRRTEFLRLVVDSLALPQVAVLRGRAEAAQTRAAGPFDVVTARAVAPLDRLAGWCLPLVTPGGVFLAMKGERASAELEHARPMLRRAGAREAEVRTLEADDTLAPTIVVSMRRAQSGTLSPRQGRGGR